jgi:hypothetical protein
MTGQTSERAKALCDLRRHCTITVSKLVFGKQKIRKNSSLVILVKSQCNSDHNWQKMEVAGEKKAKCHSQCQFNRFDPPFPFGFSLNGHGVGQTVVLKVEHMPLMTPLYSEEDKRHMS